MSNAIQKVEITNIKDTYSRVNERIYNLNEFDDQLLLYRQYCTYILNSSSTKTMLDFSLNKEVQQVAGRLDFITNRSSEKLDRDMRETLGCTGNKDPMKKDGSTIKVRITLRNAATHNLDVLIAGQSIGELVYESRKEGNKLQMYECKVVQDTNS